MAFITDDFLVLRYAGDGLFGTALSANNSMHTVGEHECVSHLPTKYVDPKKDRTSSCSTESATEITSRVNKRLTHCEEVLVEHLTGATVTLHDQPPGTSLRRFNEVEEYGHDLGRTFTTDLVIPQITMIGLWISGTVVSDSDMVGTYTLVTSTLLK